MSELQKWHAEHDKEAGFTYLRSTCVVCSREFTVYLPDSVYYEWMRGGVDAIAGKISAQTEMVLRDRRHAMCTVGGVVVLPQDPAPVQDHPVTEQDMPAPDFVLFGIPDKHNGGVILFASKNLTQAQLKSRVHLVLRDIPGFMRGIRLAERDTTLFIRFADFSMIRAGTYIDALRSLLTTWQPPDPPAQEQLAIGS